MADVNVDSIELEANTQFGEDDYTRSGNTGYKKSVINIPPDKKTFTKT